jgi:HAMP domain-containing protein
MLRMNIRTKLALALVAASLASMAVLGYFAYVSSSELLSEISRRQLDALAESRKRDLERVVDGWRENVRLIRSRTRLREALRSYDDGGDERLLDDVDRIVEDILTSGRSIRRLTIFDASDRRIAGRGDSVAEEKAQPVDGDAIELSGIQVEKDGTLGIVFHSNLEIDGTRVGGMEAVFRADAINAVTDDFTGLGETGEAYVVAAAPAEQYVILNSLRHDPGRMLRTGPLAEATPDARAALVGYEAVLEEPVEDYRGKRVLAATRSLSELGWGIVVKVDVDEEHQRAVRLLDMLTDLGLSIGALTILGGTLLGFHLARPIRQLAHIVDLARHGDIDLRAPEKGDDEVAFLARSINELLDQSREMSERKPPT